MSSSNTKIFGIRLGVDPKILVLALVALAGVLFWFNSRSDEVPSSATSSATTTRNGSVTEPLPSTNAPSGAAAARKRIADRRRSGREDRGTLRLRSVSPATGDVDPVLRLDLLDRLGKVRPASGMRNLFESGPAMAMGNGAMAMPVRHITPRPLPTLPSAPPVMQTAIPQVNIPYKYYGFAKPSVPGEANRGFFMEGDNVLFAAEGQLLQQRYRVIQLTPTTARLEDSQMRQQQTLPLVPEALDQGGGAPGAFGRQGMMQQNGMMQQGAANPGYPNQGDENQPQ